MQTRILGLGTHDITTGDAGKLVAVTAEAILQCDSPAQLGEGWDCRIKNLTYSSAVVDIHRADGGLIDGAAKVLLPFTHDNLHLAVVNGELVALDQWYRRQQIVSHRTVTIQNLAGAAWSAGIKDIGATIRCSCAAIPGVGPAQSMMIVLPPLAEIGGPPYRRGGLHIQRIDGGPETVTVFASNNEAPINGSLSGHQVNGAFAWREFYADGQQWFAR